MNDNKRVLVTYKYDEQGRPSFDRIYITHADGRIEDRKYNQETDGAFLGEFFQANGVSSVAEAEDKGVFKRLNANDYQNATEFLNGNNQEEVVTPLDDPNAMDDDDEYTDNNNDDDDDDDDATESDDMEDDEEYSDNEATPISNDNDLDDDDEYDDDEVKKDHRIAKRVGAGILTAGAIFGVLSLAHSCSKEQVVDEKNNQDLDDLYKNMTAEQKAFFEPTFKAVEEFNQRTTEDGTFKLAEDTSTLHISVDEAVALNIILNDYSSEELYSIFGTLEFDTNNIMDLARSAYSKLSTYYMNATKASGLSALINDENARQFFEEHENAVINFNNNPSTDLSDEVIKGLYYDYVYGGSTGEYAKINNNGVAWFATSAGFGFELANRNVEEFLKINNVSEAEIAKYQEAAAKVGMSLNTITTSELLNGINEEIDLDVIDEINNKSLCAAVTAETRDKVEALRMKQQIATTIISANAKENLVEGLKKIGSNSLANKVIASDTTLDADLLEEIKGASSKANQLVEDYEGALAANSSKEAKIMAILEIAKDKYEIKSEIDLPSLVNNRFRTKELEKENDVVIGKDEDGITVVDREKYDSLTKEEQQEVIKEEGTVISKTTNTVTEEVKKEDLTKEEQQQVESQQRVLEELENKKNQLITEGVNDAVTYTDEVGAYKYSKDIVIPYNNQKLNTDNMSMFNIVAYASAFGDGANEINSSDSQVQKRMEKDASARKITNEIESLSAEAKQYLQNQYGSNWREQFINESYKDGFSKQVDGSLREARAMGAKVRETAENEYKKAQEEANKSNEVVTPAEPTPSIPPQDDPNLNPDHKADDEIPYVPSTTKEEAYYLTEDQWEAAYGNTSTVEESVGKTR